MVATGPTTADVFAMGTTAGAAATGFADIGRLEVGGPADIVVIDLERLSRPFLHPDVHPLDALVFKARAGDVRSVLVAGQLVVDDGRVLTIDVEELDAQVAEWAASSLQGADARRAAADAELVEHVRAWFGAGLPLHT
jgi:cytosine/adenosine deaminase-related metal-dependent hydrolase